MRLEQVRGKIRAGAFRRRLDHIKDIRDVLGNAAGVRSEPDGAHGGNEQNPLAMFPNVEPRLLEMRTQPVHGLGRKRAFFLPSGPNGVANLAVAHVAARDPAHFQRSPRANAFFEVVGPEMGFDFLGRLELHRLSFLRRAENRRAAHLLLPLFDHSRVADDLDLPQEFVEIHAAAKARIIEPTERRLIAVVVCRPEQHAAEPATAHVGVIALGSLKLLGLLGVIIRLELAERFPLGGLLVGGHRAVFAHLVERVSWRVGGHPDAMALRFVQEHPAQPVNRVSAVARLDLFGQSGDPARFREKFHMQRNEHLLGPGNRGPLIVGALIGAAFTGTPLPVARSARASRACEIAARTTLIPRAPRAPLGSATGTLRPITALLRGTARTLIIRARAAIAAGAAITGTTVAGAPVEVAPGRLACIICIRVFIGRLFKPVG